MVGIEVKSEYIDGRNRFLKEMMLSFNYRPKYEQAFMLWIYYYWCTEEYDRHVCRHIDKNGFAWPVTSEEKIKCITNTKALLKWTKDNLTNFGIDKKTSGEAQHEALRNSHERHGEIIEDFMRKFYKKK